ncbi:YesL family protein [Evansella cellulosilytica]|uniref:DUF624 domain-containing protein n=1 Tax=Evansella cellulosilytica (strain ATCC 21833 / DSM 2522 / FERM P-1141 / JCM 9156 / N-4) TaxID=649639 RepID=E6TXM7_EVAC2|nr:DUF624 domain-containing protein [Evansella cellulosilytica]ADU28841.1 protein of unknown function DUF624 [Evansella cellulosilytica DSM 2522]
MSRVLYSMMEWITRFAYINLLWIFFTLVGGFLLGLFPSTVAMFAVVRQWLRGSTDLPVFKSFWQYYKKEFLKSNLLGIFIYLISIIFIFNVFFLHANIGELLTWTSAPLLAGLLLFIMIFIYTFPIYVHYDLKVFQIFKNAFLTLLVTPIHMFCILISLIAFYIIVTVVPALGIIFGASFYSFIAMWFSLHAFEKIRQKQKA